MKHRFSTRYSVCSPLPKILTVPLPGRSWTVSLRAASLIGRFTTLRTGPLSFSRAHGPDRLVYPLVVDLAEALEAHV